jgi:hypothetical protein
MNEAVEVRLARLEETSRSYLTRIEDMLKSHFCRIDDRCAHASEKLTLHDTRLNRHSERLDALEDFQSRVEGGWKTLAVVATVSATVGGLIVAIAAMVIR